MPSIPRVIHQSWNTSNHYQWPSKPQVWLFSWTSQAGCMHHLHSDEDCTVFMQGAYPHLMDVYQALPTGAERADLFRYCILHAQGGVWADLDTTCMDPVTSWPLDNCSLLVGVQGLAQDAKQQAERQLVRQAQIAQFVFAAAPKHPVLAAVIAEVEKRVRSELKQGKPLSTTQEAMLNRTGAGVFTDCVLAYLKPPTPQSLWHNVLVEPFIQGDTHVLPLRAFAWDKEARHMPKSQTWDRVLARHHAWGSYRPDFIF